MDRSGEGTGSHGRKGESRGREEDREMGERPNTGRTGKRVTAKDGGNGEKRPRLTRGYNLLTRVRPSPTQKNDHSAAMVWVSPS